MHVIDTHCHIHDPEFAGKYDKPVEQIIAEAKQAGVEQFICIGTDALSSERAVEFAAEHGQYATIAIHPHEVASKTMQQLDAEFKRIETLCKQNSQQLVGIGECGLDYFYHEDGIIREGQQALLRRHLDLAVCYNKPLSFHIRGAFDDFFAIIDEYLAEGKRLHGVVHSFTAHSNELKECLDRGLYIALNGIMTFTKDEEQLAAAKAIPLDKLLLETDAPFLTPKPYRGKMCELHHILLTAHVLSELRGERVEALVAATTANATKLFLL